MERRNISSGSTFEAQIGYCRPVVAGLLDTHMRIEIEVAAVRNTLAGAAAE